MSKIVAYFVGMEINTIKQTCALELLRSLPDNSIDIIFTDPPYALGSEIIIKENGKPDYKKAVDFMNKWDMPDGEFWEQWYKEAFRVLKFGGHCLMFGIDRQLMLFNYYSATAGFKTKSSIFWYFISNFPKSADLSKNIDKNAGAEREVVGKNPNERINSNSDLYGINGGKEIDITTPSTELAQKYSGYKYSVAPLKQTCETIMVFQKPYKTGSCLHDVLAMENGDESITCGALDIDGNRVAVSKLDAKKTNRNNCAGNRYDTSENSNTFKSKTDSYFCNIDSGRYPSQTFICPEVAKRLDEQSGVTTGSDKPRNNKGANETCFSGKGDCVSFGFKDTGGCSKINHVCDYDKEEHDLFIYEPKVSQGERGISDHPTMKPKMLLKKVLSLFKTPNKQIVVDTFVGSGSTVLACIDMNMDYIVGDLDNDYIEITNKRVKSHTQQTKLNLF